MEPDVFATGLAAEPEAARLLLAAARYLGETLEPERVYERFREILAEALPFDGVVVSSYDERDELIRCDYAWVDGARLETAIFPPVTLNRTGGGMQSRVIVSGESLLENDVRERVKGEGTYYDVDRKGTVRRVPESGEPGTQAAMMVPVRHDARTVGVVQVMSDHVTYTRRQLELVEGLVGQLAASVRNARLHEAVREEARARLHAEEQRRQLEAAEAATRAAAAERERAARVLEAVGDGIFLVDSAGDVRSWNRAAQLATGLHREDVEGRRAKLVFSSWPTLEAQVPVAEGGEAARAVTLPVDVNGRELWLSFVAVRTPEGVVYAFRDLTSERELEEAKSDFVATVSHELRTPLTGVLGAAETLLRRGRDLSDDDSRQLLAMISAQASRLGQITDELLITSALDRGELRIEQGQVDVDDAARKAVETMRPRLPSAISVALDPGPGGYAIGDRDRIHQILVNLIDNAIKYSPDGGTVKIETSRTDGLVRVAVADEGIGIPEAELSRVFEKFHRLHPRLVDAPTGTGLGLYICRELAVRMGGHIGVRSSEGAGSTFFVDLRAA